MKSILRLSLITLVATISMNCSNQKQVTSSTATNFNESSQETTAKSSIDTTTIKMEKIKLTRKPSLAPKALD